MFGPHKYVSMTQFLLYALMLSNSVNLAVVEVYPTLQNCDAMASRIRVTMTDHSVQASCWPTTHSDVDQAQQQLHDVVTIFAEKLQ